MEEKKVEEVAVKTTFWKKLPLSQKVSVLMLFFLLLTFPVVLLASFIQVNFYQKAAFPITPPTTPPVTVTPLPIRGFRVFVTSINYKGDLGGLAGADAKCQERANFKNLGGTWKAWLSDNTTSAAKRLYHSEIPYIRIDGKIVANNWADLTDGSIQNPIIIDEIGATMGSNIWTGTRYDGEIINPGLKCSNWTSSIDFSGPESTGHSTETNYKWTQGGSYGCTSNFSIYCFEQPPPLTNTPPEITSTSLPAGRVFFPYTATITGKDINVKDTLTMTITGLPSGIKMSSCVNSAVNNTRKIACYIKGRPTKAGVFNVSVTLRDNRGNVVKKTFPLKIKVL